MTGEHAIDVADASGTLLFDVENRRWSSTMLDALELPREYLEIPPLTPCPSPRDGEGRIEKGGSSPRGRRWGND